MIWQPIEIHFGKVPTIFRVICKLNNICMYSWLRKNPSGVLLDAEAPPFGDDENLWNTFDITICLDDSYDQPTDNDIQERQENRFNHLREQRRVYSARNIPRQDALMEEFFVLVCVLIKLTKFIKIPYRGQTTGLKTFSVLKMIFSVVKITKFNLDLTLYK